MNTYFLLFLTSFALSFAITPFIRNTALRLGYVDNPDERRVHTSPIPRVGGIAIFISFILAVAIAFLFRSSVSLQVQEQLTSILYLVGPCCLIFLVGVFDDLYNINAKAKFGVQAVAAILLYTAGYRIEAISLPFGGGLTLHYLALPVTILWIVGLSNAFNLIDGLDGLSAGASIFATLTMAVVALMNGRPIMAFLSFALAGSIVGFLRYNFNPATIFMGDSGSLFIGSMLGALSIQGAQKGSTVVAIAIPIVSFGLPILETLISMFRRFLSGDPIFRADKGHIHHVLLKRGLSMRQAVILLYAVSAAFSMFSLLFMSPDNRLLGLILCVLGLCVWIGIQQLGYHEFGEMGRLVNRGVGQRQIIAKNIKIRRAASECAHATNLAEIENAMRTFMDVEEFDHAEIRFKASGLSDRTMRDAADPAKVQGFMRWERKGSTDSISTSTDMSGYWTLRMPLYFDDGASLGEVMLYRKFDRSELMIDVNLIHTCLYPELRASLLRALEKKEARGAAGG